MAAPEYTGPPIRYSDYEREEFEWCQVVYLYARELVRAGVEEGRALEEAMLVTDVMKPHGSPTPALMTPRGRSDLFVHWPTLVCAANAYASLEPDQRRLVRDMLEAGTPASMLPARYGAGGCQRKVLDDPEYHPAPPCIPQEVASTGLLAIGAFALTALVTYVAIAASASRSK